MQPVVRIGWTLPLAAGPRAGINTSRATGVFDATAAAPSSNLRDKGLRCDACPMPLGFRCFIPEGWMSIAQPFKVGCERPRKVSPEGTAESQVFYRRNVSRPFGTYTIAKSRPNLKRVGYTR